MGGVGILHSTKADLTGWAGCQYCNRHFFYRLPAVSPCIAQDCTVDKNIKKKRGGIEKVASESFPLTLFFRDLTVSHR